MFIFKRNADLQAFLQQQRSQNKRIGFAPTMGALHTGHLQLIADSKQDNAITVCSIFVNPTQFNDKQDLEKYPRPLANDIALLEGAGCDILYLPSVEEVYPPDLTAFSFDLGYLDKPMEGASRPGHFAGVVQVVHRLLDIVRPDALYMGQKDFQQFTIIRAMLRYLQSPIRLVCVPIVREADGLAMSSRNIRLTPQGRTRAAFISQTLYRALERAATLPLPQVRQAALDDLHAYGLDDLDYLAFVDGDTLQAVQSFDQSPYIVLCIVVRVDHVRLLDNIILRHP